MILLIGLYSVIDKYELMLTCYIGSKHFVPDDFQGLSNWHGTGKYPALTLEYSVGGFNKLPQLLTRGLIENVAINGCRFYRLTEKGFQLHSYLHPRTSDLDLPQRVKLWTNTLDQKSARTYILRLFSRQLKYQRKLLKDVPPMTNVDFVEAQDGEAAADALSLTLMPVASWASPARLTHSYRSAPETAAIIAALSGKNSVPIQMPALLRVLTATFGYSLVGSVGSNETEIIDMSVVDTLATTNFSHLMCHRIPELSSPETLFLAQPANIKEKHLAYEDAVTINQKWRINSKEEYLRFIETHFAPAGMPVDPPKVYGEFWVDWDAYLKGNQLASSYRHRGSGVNGLKLSLMTPEQKIAVAGILKSGSADQMKKMLADIDPAPSELNNVFRDQTYSFFDVFLPVYQELRDAELLAHSLDNIRSCFQEYIFALMVADPQLPLLHALSPETRERFEKSQLLYLARNEESRYGYSASYGASLLSSLAAVIRTNSGTNGYQPVIEDDLV